MTPLAKRTIEILNSLLGLKEATGNNDGPFLNFLQERCARAIGMDVHAMDKEPWCVMLGTWAIQEAALALQTPHQIPIFVGVDAVYDWAVANKKVLACPVPGCIGLLKNASGGWEHYFTVRNVNADGSLDGIDGNWSNSVCLTSHDPASCAFVELC